jgi:Rrf2 family protein
MKLFSKSSEYTIRVLLYALDSKSGEKFSPSELCEIASVPEPFTRKGLQSLAKAGILRGVRGPGGGYYFVKKPEEISLYDVVQAVDGSDIFLTCPLGETCPCPEETFHEDTCLNCSFQEPKCIMGSICPMHDLWKDVRTLVLPRLKTISLREAQTMDL